MNIVNSMISSATCTYVFVHVCKKMWCVLIVTISAKSSPQHTFTCLRHVGPFVHVFFDVGMGEVQKH